MSSDRIALAEETLTMLGEIAYGWRHGDADHNLPTLAEHIPALVAEIRCSRRELAALRADHDAGGAVAMREAAAKVSPCREPTSWSDDTYLIDPRIEIVAKDIARDGLGVDWEDLTECNAHAFDRNDLRAYAKAAINSMATLASQEGSGC